MLAVTSCSLLSLVLRLVVTMLLLCVSIGGLVMTVWMSRVRARLRLDSVVISLFKCGELTLVSCVKVGTVLRLLCRADRLCGCVDPSVMCVRTCLRLLRLCSVLCSGLKVVVLSSVLTVRRCVCSMLWWCSGWPS